MTLTFVSLLKLASYRFIEAFFISYHSTVITFLQNPPNFLIMGDFRTYVTQEVVVPQELEHDEESINEGNLIDTTDDGETENHNSSQNNAPSMDMHLEIIQEREFLRSQCEKLR